VQSITAENGAALSAYELEPQLITALSEDKNRTKRRLVTYQEIPPRLVQAIVAIEDRDFFNHGGVNYLRIAKCAVADLVTHHKTCGGSTLTQQLAKNLFLSPEKRLKRKIIEVLITFQLEARFSKPQIFEMYANEMNLGHRGSYEINGVGEAAQAVERIAHDQQRPPVADRVKRAPHRAAYRGQADPFHHRAVSIQA